MEIAPQLKVLSMGRSRGGWGGGGRGGGRGERQGVDYP